MKHGYKRHAKFTQERDPQLIGMVESFDTVSTDSADSTDDWPWPRLSYILDSLEAGDEIYVQSLDKIASSIEDVEKLTQKLIEASATLVIVDSGQKISNDNIGILSTLKTIKSLQASISNEIKAGTKRGPKPQLTEEQAAEIRLRAENGEMVSKLAREFGVSRAILYRKYDVKRSPKSAD